MRGQTVVHFGTHPSNKKHIEIQIKKPQKSNAIQIALSLFGVPYVSRVQSRTQTTYNTYEKKKQKRDS